MSFQLLFLFTAIAAFVESYAISELENDQELKFELVLSDDPAGEDHRRMILENPKVLESARHYLPFLRERGMLDVPSS